MFEIIQNNKYLEDNFSQTLEVLISIKESEEFKSNLIKIAGVFVDAFRNNKRIYIAGNGGSAADAQHFSAELVSRFAVDRNPLPSLALSTDTSAITAIGNDYGFDDIFSRQLFGLGDKGDIFVGITTSGKSRNILNAFEVCKEKEIISVALCGMNCIKSFTPDFLISIPSNSTPKIQEMHLISYHILCGIIERSIFKGGKDNH